MMAMNLKTIINISGSHKRPNLISMRYWVRKVLKAVIVLVGRGEQILFQIQLTSALKDLHSCSLFWFPWVCKCVNVVNILAEWIL